MKYICVAMVLALSFNAFAAGKNKKAKRPPSGDSRVYENVHSKNTAQAVEAEVVEDNPKTKK